ncbi:zinc-ribbon domain-containing protein [Sulfitobacter sp. D35]|uniref:zinc-ribbon domain-containing protein n=1 Tax=Sulfitobacter sp. D35 TaxID=3083252 RepID=UPI00296FE69C|nr:zinc-ribbon domain-containing protein [Sulfitobacter sp. D35]MDW4499046.1 zinc-ribbon domain-containing protein [Sulfitobacter sp. D35]
MRLICPNCDAQYEVPEGVMPPEGRDVQCSNCGQTWFQEHPDHPENTGVEADAEGAEPISEPDATETPDQAAALERARAARTGVSVDPDREAEPDPLDDPAEPEVAAPARPAPPRRTVDPTVADILREEAELETRARGEERTTLESQPDLGLGENDAVSEGARRAREARSRMAELVTAAGATGAAASQSRRDLLPDIEEINSTLRSSSERIASGDETEIAAANAREAKSSARGFVFVIVVAAILSLVYVFAPQLAEAVPQLDPWISAYVGMVDSWRMWLDTQVGDLLRWLEETARAKGEADAAAVN